MSLISFLRRGCLHEKCCAWLVGWPGQIRAIAIQRLGCFVYEDKSNEMLVKNKTKVCLTSHWSELYVHVRGGTAAEQHCVGSRSGMPCLLTAEGVLQRGPDRLCGGCC